MSNEAGLCLTKNLLTSVEKVGIPLSQVTLYKLADGGQDHLEYNTPPFKNMMIRKMEVILDALETNQEVLWVDSDIIFFTDFLKDIRSRAATSEICFQQSIVKYAFCAGFIFIKSSHRTKEFFKGVIRCMKENPSVCDEFVMNQIYFQMGIRASALPYWHYPVGAVFFKGDGMNGMIQKDAYILHNNYIVGNQNKIERFKKFGLWNIDETILSRVETRIWKTAD